VHKFMAYSSLLKLLLTLSSSIPNSHTPLTNAYTLINQTNASFAYIYTDWHDTQRFSCNLANLELEFVSTIHGPMATVSPCSSKHLHTSTKHTFSTDTTIDSLNPLILIGFWVLLYNLSCQKFHISNTDPFVGFSHNTNYTFKSNTELDFNTNHILHKARST
jgi:hypothetical protein